MIHRHKHEMTLKFPSIKTDNMLSGKEPSGKEAWVSRSATCEILVLRNRMIYHWQILSLENIHF